MALEDVAFRELAKRGKGSILCLSYPDLLVKESTMKELYPGVELPEVKNAEEVAGWHNWQGKIYDTEAVFAHMGLVPDFIDVKAWRGPEVVVDLNKPQKMGQYEFVLDPGTLEHCFNIGVAAMNAIKAVKMGGYIIHTNPMTMVNHGFYNLCPTFYYDLYTQNGFEVEVLKGLVGHPAMRAENELHPHNRVALAQEVTSLVVAKRLFSMLPTMPIQEKYRRIM